MIVLEDNDNVPIVKNEKEEFEIPEYVKMCAELSVDVASREGEIEAKVFHLITGTAIFGICVGEIRDSFLVAMPAQLVSENGKIDGKAFTKGRIIRLIRSSIAFVSIPEPDHRYYYYKWLKKQYTSLPSFFSKSRCDIVDKFVYAYENRSSKNTEEHNEEPEDGFELEADDSSGSPDSFWSIYRSTEFH
jgi:hypothetical protein